MRNHSQIYSDYGYYNSVVALEILLTTFQDKRVIMLSDKIQNYDSCAISCFVVCDIDGKW